MRRATTSRAINAAILAVAAGVMAPVILSLVASVGRYGEGAEAGPRPATGTVTYPYYTTRGGDFLAKIRPASGRDVDVVARLPHFRAFPIRRWATAAIPSAMAVAAVAPPRSFGDEDVNSSFPAISKLPQTAAAFYQHVGKLPPPQFGQQRINRAAVSPSQTNTTCSRHHQAASGRPRLMPGPRPQAPAFPGRCVRVGSGCRARRACREPRVGRCAVRGAAQSATDRPGRPFPAPPRSHPPGRVARAQSAATAGRRSSGFLQRAWRSCRRASWPTWR